MKTQNQTPKKNNSYKVEKNKAQGSLKHSTEEKTDQSNNKLDVKKAIPSDDKSNKKRSR